MFYRHRGAKKPTDAHRLMPTVPAAFSGDGVVDLLSSLVDDLLRSKVVLSKCAVRN